MNDKKQEDFFHKKRNNKSRLVIDIQSVFTHKGEENFTQ